MGGKKGSKALCMAAAVKVARNTRKEKG